MASALTQPETREVILVEDGSSDNSRAICEQLAARHQIVHLLRHPDSANLGASVSRNAGMSRATQDYIAFLDADDTFLPGRFHETAQIFSAYPDTDGVYETVGTRYHDASMRARHQAREKEHIGLSVTPEPDQLFRALALGRYGFIHLDGLVLRRAALTPDLQFDPELIQCQDSDFILRASRRLKLRGGKPSRIVAMRGIHSSNRIFDHQQAMHYRRRFLQKCIDHHFYGSQDMIANLYIVSRRVGASRAYRPFRHPRILGLPVKLLFVACYLLGHPAILVRLLSRSSGSV